MSTMSILATQIGLARAHAESFNQKAPDWRAHRGFILESAVYGHVTENSPPNVSNDEIRIIVGLTLEELEKMPAPQEPEQRKNPGFIDVGPDTFEGMFR